MTVHHEAYEEEGNEEWDEHGYAVADTALEAVKAAVDALMEEYDDPDHIEIEGFEFPQDDSALPDDVEGKYTYCIFEDTTKNPRHPDGSEFTRISVDSMRVVPDTYDVASTENGDFEEYGDDLLWDARIDDVLQNWVDDS